MNLTLYEIEDGLAKLIEYRAERLLDTADPPTPEELAAVDNEIDKYQFKEPAKVAGVAAIFRMWKAQRTNIKAERDRLRALDRFLEAAEARLKDRVAAALDLLPSPAKGCKKLTGHEGSVLMLKGNGGIEPLQIDGWDSEEQRWLTQDPVLPDNFMDLTVTLPKNKWINLLIALPESLRPQEAINDDLGKPNGDRIRAAIAKPCPVCKGDTVFAIGRPEDKRCAVCGGTGKQVVPGARLLPRGSHVECR